MLATAYDTTCECGKPKRLGYRWCTECGIAWTMRSTSAPLTSSPAHPARPGDDDAVEHPKHYTAHPSGVECIEIAKHHNFTIGNAIKYLWRQGLKRDADKSVKQKQIEDLKKARWYIDCEIKSLESAA